MDLLRKHQPVFVFHSDEEYFPVKINDYIQNQCELWSTNHLLSSNPTSRMISGLKNIKLKQMKVTNGSVDCDELMCRVVSAPNKTYLIYVPCYGDGQLKPVVVELDLHEQVVGFHLSRQKFVESTSMLVDPYTDRYKVYVSRRKHENDSRPVAISRYMGLVKEYPEDGKKWLPPNLFQIFLQTEDEYNRETMGFVGLFNVWDVPPVV